MENDSDVLLTLLRNKTTGALGFKIHSSPVCATELLGALSYAQIYLTELCKEQLAVDRATYHSAKEVMDEGGV
jgi:hypothetical protein